MEKHVVSRELAEKLKEAGYPHNTFNVYERSDSIPKGEWYLTQPEFMRRYGLWTTQEVKERMAAPMTDELLEQLPNYIQDNYLQIIAYGDKYEATYQRIGGSRSWLVSESNNKPVDALAQLWLYCKANGHIKAEEATS